ncbi:DUF3450 family protein [Pseudoalteromonas aurantia]|uniref:DUF3450 domain-containing protein n=1 Tax=Pseudoalteromonas aurantia TaxID=43654 RepID=A0A5S3V7F3_9GAMM|nr:DUF3450 family protein [Pseudoalteromonas aurantia]TMO67797.1 hypothetical protein CWC19_11935 [Pseudoalteromonas aurantia]TMO78167.1 hypothetical protein CWC20_02040 [Pseudoalteromonas aurantia]
MNFLFVMTALSLHGVSSTSQSDYELMQQWLDLESQRGKLESTWQTNKQFLKNQISLLSEEKKSLQALLLNAKNAQNEVDEKRLALTEKQVQYERNQNLVENELSKGENFITRVLPMLPPPLQSELQIKSEKLKQNTINLSERLEIYLGLYKSVDEFNSRIALNTSNMTVSIKGKETEVLVSQIYLGLSQAWYLSADGSAYGFGRTEQSGWQWYHGEAVSSVLPSMNLPEQIKKIRGILEKPTTAEFVSLPLSLPSLNKELL